MLNRTQITTHLYAITLAVVTTLTLLAGVDTLAVQEHAGTQAAQAAAAAASQTAQAKAPRMRS
jgi:hypothetical protein